MKLLLSIAKNINKTDKNGNYMYGIFHETIECKSFDVTTWEDLPFPSMFVTCYNGMDSQAIVGVTFIDSIP